MAILILPSFLITTGREAPKKEWGVRVVGDQIVEADMAWDQLGMLQQLGAVPAAA